MASANTTAMAGSAKRHALRCTLSRICWSSFCAV